MPIRHSSNGIQPTCLPYQPILFDGQTLATIGLSSTSSLGKEQE